MKKTKKKKIKERNQSCWTLAYQIESPVCTLYVCTLNRRIVRWNGWIITTDEIYRRAGSVEKIVFCYAKGRCSKRRVSVQYSFEKSSIGVGSFGFEIISLDDGINESKENRETSESNSPNWYCGIVWNP